MVAQRTVAVRQANTAARLRAAPRAPDEIAPNVMWLVAEGTANAGTAWWVTTTTPITVDTSTISIGQFTAPAAVSFASTAKWGLE